MMRSPTKIRMSILSALAACAIVAGCETGPSEQVPSVQKSGFLGDYSVLRKGGEGEAALVFWNEKADFRSYDKILLDRTSIWAADKDALKYVSPIDRQYLANVLNAVIWQELKDDYKFVALPGPGTMRVRVAITGATPSAPVLDTVSTYLPPARLAFKVLTLNSDTDAYVASASVEGEVRDSLTGELLAAGVDRRAGTKYLGKAEGGIGNWKDVRKAFRAWAQQFKANLLKRRLR